MKVYLDRLRLTLLFSRESVETNQVMFLAAARNTCVEVFLRLRRNIQVQKIKQILMLIHLVQVVS